MSSSSFAVRTGLTAESNPNAMGEPYNGYAGLVGSRYRVAHRCVTKPQAIRPHEGSYFENNDEEHHRTLNLSAHCRVPFAFPRCVVFPWCTCIYVRMYCILIQCTINFISFLNLRTLNIRTYAVPLNTIFMRYLSILYYVVDLLYRF